ncbi:MAG TPA: hypothetical protein VM942_06165 [Acidimicrobiales bacterium]|nr:hypothetical protein [Acidimicrobiales bacterium]
MRNLADPLAGSRWAVVTFALAIALAGCSDANPVEEIRAGSSRLGHAGPGSPTDGSTTMPPPDGSRASDGSSDPVGPGGPGQTEPGQPGSIDPSPPVPGGAHPPAGNADPPATTAPGNNRHAHSWDGSRLGADGRTVTFTYYAGVEPCSAFDSIVADEGPHTVRVTIYEHSGPEGVACIMLAQQKSASVTLAAPLGSRALVDGAVSS